MGARGNCRQRASSSLQVHPFHRKAVKTLSLFRVLFGLEVSPYLCSAAQAPPLHLQAILLLCCLQPLPSNPPPPTQGSPEQKSRPHSEPPLPPLPQNKAQSRCKGGEETAGRTREVQSRQCVLPCPLKTRAGGRAEVWEVGGGGLTAPRHHTRFRTSRHCTPGPSLPLPAHGQPTASCCSVKFSPTAPSPPRSRGFPGVPRTPPVPSTWPSLPFASGI